MESLLSPQERETLAAYQRIAHERAQQRNDPQWCGAAFQHFTRTLPGGRILDVGCGHGQNASIFTTYGYRYTGIDISPAMLTLARQYEPRAMFTRMNMHQLGFSNACFDGFWAAASLLHIPKSQVTRPLKEIKRVVRHKGIGFICLREGDTEEMVTKNLRGDNRFYAFYRQEEFFRILTENGFEVIGAGRDLREFNAAEQQNIHNVWLTFFVRNL